MLRFNLNHISEKGDWCSAIHTFDVFFLLQQGRDVLETLEEM